jgi:hypothetical protein
MRPRTPSWHRRGVQDAGGSERPAVGADAGECTSTRSWRVRIAIVRPPEATAVRLSAWWSCLTRRRDRIVEALAKPFAVARRNRSPPGSGLPRSSRMKRPRAAPGRLVDQADGVPPCIRPGAYQVNVVQRWLAAGGLDGRGPGGTVGAIPDGTAWPNGVGRAASTRVDTRVGRCASRAADSRGTLFVKTM